jgi:hypothetical protein
MLGAASVISNVTEAVTLVTVFTVMATLAVYVPTPRFTHAGLGVNTRFVAVELAEPFIGVTCSQSGTLLALTTKYSDAMGSAKPKVTEDTHEAAPFAQLNETVFPGLRVSWSVAWRMPEQAASTLKTNKFRKSFGPDMVKSVSPIGQLRSGWTQFAYRQIGKRPLRSPGAGGLWSGPHF